MSLFSKHYEVVPLSDDWTEPEQTLVDATGTLADMERPVPDGLFRAGTYLVVAVMACLVTVTGFLAVRDHDRLAALSEANRTISVAVPPPRGLILDRNGTHLVENAPSFDLLVISRQVERSSDGTFPGVPVLADALGIDAEELTFELAQSVRRNAVFFLATDITKDQALTLTGILPSGFSIITSTKRDYLDGERFSAVIGYVGKVSPADIAGDDYYLPSDTIGRAGVEASYEPILRGVHGELAFRIAEPSEQAARQGLSVVLHLDADAQRALYDTTADVLREGGLSRAAAVVQDPRTGGIISLVSFPSYDNGVFTRRLGQEQFEYLFENEQRPLFNRVIGGRYNPGSTIKPFIGMAALQDGVVRPGTAIPDCNAISIPNPSDPSDPYVFRNWRPEAGSFDLYRAIADSCNIYFFTVGGGFGTIDGLGVGAIVRYLRQAGADMPTGVDLPGEDAGFVPDPDWKWYERKEPWYQGDTYNISIGQGDLLVTPLWVNAYVSAISNGGTLYRPQVAARIINDQGQSVERLDAVPIAELPFDAEVIRTMQRAMRRTVEDGTARILNTLPVSVAAKTGTAEVVKGQRVNSLLTLYAPADNPAIAMTVLVEGTTSENQGYAIRIANTFLRWYFTRTPGASPVPVPSVSPVSTPSPAPSPVPSP